MSKKTVWFIVNPISGNGSKQAIIDMVNARLDPDMFEWQICPTQYAGHGAVLATMAAENGIDVVVAIGGDGTVNEVARSLVHTDTVMGIIPCGSGNGLARHLQIPLEPAKAIEMINHFNTIDIDYGLINRRPFFCTCGMGYDAAVSYKFQSSDKRGLLTYIENTLIGLAKYKSEVYTIYDEHGKHSYKAFCIALANASQYGNNAYIAPKASMTDGLMDVTVVEPFLVVEAPSMAFMLFSGMFRNGVNHIKTFRTDKLRIVREKSGVIHCDGEPMKAGREISVEIIHAGLRIITNSDAQAHTVPLIKTIGEQMDTIIQPPGEVIRQANKSITKLFKPKK